LGWDWLQRAKKELWLVVSLVAITALLNVAVTSEQMVLGFYALPTLGSAYFFGRRHATLTAFASILIVVGATFTNPEIFEPFARPRLPIRRVWLDLTVWGGILTMTAYAMGTLYEHKARQMAELRQTYQGVLDVLRHFLMKDKQTEHHCSRVSVYAAQIAAAMKLGEEPAEDIRVAALLHDIGKLDIDPELLYKTDPLTPEELDRIRQHVHHAATLLQPIGGLFRRVLPIILAVPERFDGAPNGAHKDVVLAARVIAVADAFDSLTTDRPYRKAVSTEAAEAEITKASGTQFDPGVVDAFLLARRRSGGFRLQAEEREPRGPVTSG
jgi:putative nucleotidyltransferase with HDIG domain